MANVTINLEVSHVQDWLDNANEKDREAIARSLLVDGDASLDSVKEWASEQLEDTIVELHEYLETCVKDIPPPDAAGLAESLSTGHAIYSHKWLTDFIDALRGPELALAQRLLLSR